MEMQQTTTNAITGLGGRVPPQDVNAEKALLGILIMNSSLLDEVSTVLRSDDFYQRSHQAIFSAMLAFKEKEKSNTLDLGSLITYLVANGKIGECGGASYLAELSSGDRAALSSNAKFYSKAIKDSSRRRKAITFASKLRDRCFEDSVDIQSILNDALGELGLLSVDGSTGAQYSDMQKVVAEIYKVVDPTQKLELGLMSGFKYLDDVTGGFRKQEMTIIGARPSIGKTAFALSIALNMVMSGVRVGFFSLEMPLRSIGCRLLSAQSGVPFSHILKRTFTNDESSRIIDAMGEFYNKNFFVQDVANMKLMDLRAQAHQMKMKSDVEIIFVDYMGLIEPDDQNARDERFNWISKVSRQIKQLARELDIPIVVLCQVSREAEDQEPKLSNLRDSGSIEQDADVVLLLHRPRPKEGEERKQIEETSLIVAKNRNGETGVTKIAFQGAIVKFYNLENAVGYTPANNSRA